MPNYGNRFLTGVTDYSAEFFRTIANDTFVRSNQSGWGTSTDGNTYTTTVGSATLAIASNEGTATACTASTNMELGSATSINADARVRVSISDVNINRAGVSLRQTATNTFYMARISAANTSIGFSISKVVAGTTTDIFTTSFTASFATFYNIRFRAIGSTLQAKVWLAGTQEPATWTVSGTDTSITTAGGFGLTINSTSAASTWSFDSFNITDGTDTTALQTRLKMATQVTKSLQARLKMATQVTKTLAARFIERTQITKTLAARFIERTQITKTLAARFIERTLVTKTLQARFVYKIASITKSLQVRFIERTQNTKTLTVRLRESTILTKTLQARLYMTRYTRTLPARFIERTQIIKTLQVRLKESVRSTKTLAARFIERTQITKTLQTRFKLQGSVTKILQLRARLRTLTTKTLSIRAIIVGPRLLSGGFALFANGTGTASYDHFRVSQFPDPSLALGPVLPRAGATGIIWTSNTPTNTSALIDISSDGVNWTNIGSSNSAVPGIFSQPLPTIDAFSTNTSANYISTNRTGGAAGTWTYDTTNSRIVATGGTNAFYLNSSISRADIDFFADMDIADNGGLCWRFTNQSNFYYLTINDSLSSTGTINTIALYRVASNVQTQLATSSISYVVGAGTGSQYTVNFTRSTYRRFRVTMLSNMITIYVDGNVLINYTDGSPLSSAGQVGLFNNAGTTGSRFYQLWINQVGDYVSGIPSGDTVTGNFLYTRVRLSTTDPTVTPQVSDLATYVFPPTIQPGANINGVTYTPATTIAKNFDDLAKQSNTSWFVDTNQLFNFSGSGVIAAPWIAQSAIAGIAQNVDIEYDSSLELDVQNDLYRNRQTVTGALATGSYSESKIGDGTTRSFTLGYPLAAAPTVYYNTVLQTVGLKGTTGSQFYYALNDPVLIQDTTGNLVQKTDILSITYSGYATTNVTVDNGQEQAARAIVEGGTGIVESSLDVTGQNVTVAAATAMATNLITRYATQGRTLIFMTSRSGLAVGQVLSIFLPEHGIQDGAFYIQTVEITLTKGVGDSQIYWYKVTCSELPKQASWAKLIGSGLTLN